MGIDACLRLPPGKRTEGDRVVANTEWACSRTAVIVVVIDNDAADRASDFTEDQWITGEAVDDVVLNDGIGVAVDPAGRGVVLQIDAVDVGASVG